jgi:hypothetical protein
MENNYKTEIDRLLSDPDKLKVKKPFTRGADLAHAGRNTDRRYVDIGETVQAYLPNYRSKVVSQEQFMLELDPNCHSVLFDENIPSLCVKVADGDYRDVRYQKMAIPIQKCIKNKQTMHLAANPMQFTMLDVNPTDNQQDNFIAFKQYWNLRNQDGMKYKMVDTQLSYGDAGLLYYTDYKGRIKSRILSFKDGYVLCPHNDQNGDRILESVYYIKDNVEYIDSYDDTYMYRCRRESLVAESDESGWIWDAPQLHGFSEIPLITKRGEVAWNNVQPIIDCYEELYNVFNAIQKRFGWGIFYVKGKFKEQAHKIAGSVVLNDTSVEGKGDAKFLTPPTPQGTIDTLNLMMESIQLGSSTTFILPKDIKMSGDVSGIAVQLTQSQDNELALQNVIDWQNVADKMVRLFKEGLAKELVNTGINEKAITEFAELNIGASFKVWRPLNETEYNNMVAQLKGAGIISLESGIELNTLSKPDEKARVAREREEAERKAIEIQNVNAVNNQNGVGSNNKNNNNGNNQE